MKKLEFTHAEKFNATEYLLLLTGRQYSFAKATTCVWDTPDNTLTAPQGEYFYQLMPDGKDDGFFDWYCKQRPYNQYYKDKIMCVLAFNLSWHKWLKVRKSTPHDIPQLSIENSN